MCIRDSHYLAKDAYLNIVVGNVWYTKFTLSPIWFIEKEYRTGKSEYNLNRMYDFDVVRNDRVAWIAEDVYKRQNKEDKKVEYKQFINTYIKGNEDVVLLTRSLISETEFPPEKFCLDYQKNNPENAGKSVINDREVIQRENKVLEEVGFVSINDYVGYEYGDAYISVSYTHLHHQKL